MLTREQIARLRIDACELEAEDQSVAYEICNMALASLDVADIVPGDGYVVERVRRLVHANEARAYERVNHLETSKHATEKAYQELRTTLAALADAAEHLVLSVKTAGVRFEVEESGIVVALEGARSVLSSNAMSALANARRAIP